MASPASVTQDAIFVGANKKGHVLAYAPGAVAFGAGNAVALWNPFNDSHQGVHQTLQGHTKQVTCVGFMPVSYTLVSGGEDGQVLVWQKAPGGLYRAIQAQAHEPSSVTCLATADASVFVTGSALGDVCIWKLTAGEAVRMHSFQVGPRFYPTALCVQKINGTYLLVVGGTSTDLFVYTFSADCSAVCQCAVLAGHDDWVRCLSIAGETEGRDYLLASGSQDRYIRLWRLRLGDAIDDCDEDASRLVLLANKQHKFSFGSSRAALSFEALLMGHDDWVTGVTWRPGMPLATAHGSPAGNHPDLQLLSLSADTALIVWEMDAGSGIWVPASRLGELSTKGASTATGASGGFWACLWLNDPTDSVPDSESCAMHILASGKTGSIRMYRTTDPRARLWEAVLGITGPVRDVTDVVWSPEGTCVLATSLDQTTRLLAPWKLRRDAANAANAVTWHEFARPQIHGYDMVCAAWVSPTRFVSGGDEKILRVFDMTRSLGAMLHKFCGVDYAEGEALSETASLPVLGLSNKAANEQLEQGEAQQREEDFEADAEGKTQKNDVLAELEGPPLEDHLQRHTLFPELEKLYGHGYEITCCAVSPRRSLVASACRSNSAKHAVIRVFNAKKDYLLAQHVMGGHNLTIVSLEFSPDGEFLLAVSRDRQFSLWRVEDEADAKFALVELNAKAHSRIIWDCSWAPQGTPVFATGSRDKALKVWKICGSGVELAGAVKTEHAITSVACFQKELIKGKLLVAVGHENGRIAIYAVSPGTAGPPTQVVKFGAEISPGSRVNKLAFSKKSNGLVLQLAVGSVDTSVRIYSVDAAALAL